MYTAFWAFPMEIVLFVHMVLHARKFHAFPPYSKFPFPNPHVIWFEGRENRFKNHKQMQWLVTGIYLKIQSFLSHLETASPKMEIGDRKSESLLIHLPFHLRYGLSQSLKIWSSPACTGPLPFNILIPLFVFFPVVRLSFYCESFKSKSQPFLKCAIN